MTIKPPIGYDETRNAIEREVKAFDGFTLSSGCRDHSPRELDRLQELGISPPMIKLNA